MINKRAQNRHNNHGRSRFTAPFAGRLCPVIRSMTRCRRGRPPVVCLGACLRDIKTSLASFKLSFASPLTVLIPFAALRRHYTVRENDRAQRLLWLLAAAVPRSSKVGPAVSRVGAPRNHSLTFLYCKTTSIRRAGYGTRARAGSNTLENRNNLSRPEQTRCNSKSTGLPALPS